MKKKTKAWPVAAIDLGSNSFHLVRADVIDGQLHTRHRSKVRVQLAQGLDSTLCLSDQSIQRGLAALDRFQEHIRDLSPAQLRVVGTHTLRQARNVEAFLEPAQALLGCSIEVISGPEEGRLTYQGVALSQPVAERTLLVDIGGGSTELVMGHGHRIKDVTSRSMGCVVFHQRYFNDHPGPTPALFAQARSEARRLVQGVRSRFEGSEVALGSSGSIKAIMQAVLALSDHSVITRSGLEIIEDELCALSLSDFMAQSGVSSDRYPVLAAGVAILQGVFEGLELVQMEAAQGALREGLLCSFLPDSSVSNARQAGISEWQRRLHIDAKQAERVARDAKRFAQILGVEEGGLLERLAEACALHESGQSINYSDYHQHGRYLIEQSDLPGFHRRDQVFVAQMVGLQRKKLPCIEHLSSPEQRALLALRLAILANVTRREDEGFTLASAGQEWQIHPRDHWRLADIDKEAKRRKPYGIGLKTSLVS
ncbi:MAG: exopolyphosphatase [Litorivicinus sp.]